MSDKTEHVLQILLTEARAGDDDAAAWLRSTTARELCAQAGVVHARLMRHLEDAPGATVQLSEAEWQECIVDKYLPHLE